jgi:hypothetical protein
MLTAAGLLDRLCRVAIGNDPPHDGGWFRVTEATGRSNWTATLSTTFIEAYGARWKAECERLSIAFPVVDWTDVIHRRGSVRELTHYWD